MHADLALAARAGAGPKAVRTVLGAALVGVLGLLSPGGGALGHWPDLVAVLVWLALVAPAAGYACGAAGARGVLLLVAPGVWALVIAAAASRSDVELPGALWAGLAAAGLFALGLGPGRCAPGRPWTGAGLLLLAGALLVGLPVRAGFSGPSFTERAPRLGRALFEVSPATLLVESAGVDWTRHEAVYHAAGTDWLPGERRAYRGSLAGPLCFVVGCLALVLVPRSVRRRERRGPFLSS